MHCAECLSQVSFFSSAVFYLSLILIFICSRVKYVCDKVNLTEVQLHRVQVVMEEGVSQV